MAVLDTSNSSYKVIKKFQTSTLCSDFGVDKCRVNELRKELYVTSFEEGKVEVIDYSQFDQDHELPIVSKGELVTYGKCMLHFCFLSSLFGLIHYFQIRFLIIFVF